VKYMIDTNPEVRTVIYNRLARDQEVKQARAGYFPELGLIAGAGFQEIREPVDQSLDPWEFTLGLRQNVFRGLQDVNEVNRQKARVRSKAYIIQSTAENTALQTARSYLQVLRKEGLNDLAHENLVIHKRIADQIRLRSESGVGRKADMSQVESRLSLAESNVVVTESNLVDAQTNYLAVVGHLPENLVKPDPPDEAMPISLEELQQVALAEHPTLKSAEEDLDARYSQDEVARAPFMPIVDIEIDKRWSEDLDYGLNTNDDAIIGMLRVRYNFFRGWKDSARKVETAYLVSEAREIRNNTHRQVVENVRLSWMAYKAVQGRINYLKDRIESAAMTARAYGKQWDIGKRTLLDVLDAEAELIDAKKELLDAEYDGLIAQYRILNGMGKLVHSLDLEWPEEAYVEDKERPADEGKENL
jgi:adhesin transport system outer membrane protein